MVMGMMRFYQVGAAGHEVEQYLQGPPLPPELLFWAKTGETQNPGPQGDFRGVRFGAQEDQAGGHENRDWKKLKIKGGKPAKGIGTEYPPPLHQEDQEGGEEDARARPYRSWLDNAKAHTSADARAELDKHFDEVVFQSPSSPEMSTPPLRNLPLAPDIYTRHPGCFARHGRL